MEFEYVEVIVLVVIIIYEIYNLGVVFKLLIYMEIGMYFELWSGEDFVEVKDGCGISEIFVKMRMKIN